MCAAHSADVEQSCLVGCSASVLLGPVFPKCPRCCDVSTLVLSCIGDVDRGKAAAHRCIPSVESNLGALPIVRDGPLGNSIPTNQPTNRISPVGCWLLCCSLFPRLAQLRPTRSASRASVWCSSASSHPTLLTRSGLVWSVFAYSCHCSAAAPLKRTNRMCCR
jgi:hypothetical protein